MSNFNFLAATKQIICRTPPLAASVFHISLFLLMDKELFLLRDPDKNTVGTHMCRRARRQLSIEKKYKKIAFSLFIVDVCWLASKSVSVKF